jgi:hypothetical protein
MSALYFWDVFSTLDGYGTYADSGDWAATRETGPGAARAPRLELQNPQRMVHGATTSRDGRDPHRSNGPARARRVKGLTHQSPATGAVVHLDRQSRLAGREHRERIGRRARRQV